MSNKTTLFLIICLVSSISFAKDCTCKLNSSILKRIAFVEKHKKREAGYPYLISLNNKKDIIKVKRELGNSIFLDNRTMDCRNRELCTKIAVYLIKEKKIKNLDLGAYQINYIYHKMDIKNYFSFNASYEKACSILENLIAKYGYTWKTIARYHSSTPKYNFNYLVHISQINSGENNDFKK